MISVIIPTYNEGAIIKDTIHLIRQQAVTSDLTEIIVADGQSTDNTVKLCSQAGVTVIVCNQKGRSAQMNAGAAIAKGDLLYFIHADCIPPKNFSSAIIAVYK